jgi:hypothetical protein
MIRRTLAIGFCAIALSACGSSEEAAPAAADSATDVASEATAETTGAAEQGVPKVAFKIENATSLTLTHLYLSPAASDTWDRDILGDQTAPAGATIDVTIDDGVESCMYDLRARFENDETMDVRGVNICEIEGRTVTVSQNG